MIDNSSYNINFFQSNTFGLIIGAIAGFIKSSFQFMLSDLTFRLIFDTFVLASVGAVTGIAITAFFQWLKKKWLGKK